MLFYFSYLKFELLLWNIELIFMLWHVFVVNGNTGKGTHALCGRKFHFDHLATSYNGDLILLFNRCIVVSLLW